MGSPGPGARQFMQQTLEGTGELAEALKLVDEQLLTGLDEGARNALPPILVRPLMQAFAALVPPTEAELKRVWNAQVFEPYERTLASKYPFDRGSRMEATQVELAAIFGTEGAVAKYLEQSLGTLVLRRGEFAQPLQHPGDVADSFFGVAAFGQWMQVFPMLLAHGCAQSQPAGEPAMALGHGAGFGEPQGQAEIFRARCKQGFAAPHDTRPIRLLERCHPLTLLQGRVVSARISAMSSKSVEKERSSPPGWSPGKGASRGRCPWRP